MKTKKQTTEQFKTIAACIKMPISHKCGCTKKLNYKPSSMTCRKCILAERFMFSFSCDGLLRALRENDLEKAINILSEVN